MSTQPNVADYIVRRLAREGITECFGVAGDFAFQIDDAVARSEAIRWIGCSNELDAAYAADGLRPRAGLLAALGHVRRRRRAAKGDSACYIEVGGGKTDYPAGLAAAHGRLEALYADV